MVIYVALQLLLVGLSQLSQLYHIIYPIIFRYFATTTKHPGPRGFPENTSHRLHGAGSEHQRSGRRVQCQARAVACHGAKTPWFAARGAGWWAITFSSLPFPCITLKSIAFT